MHQNYQTKDKKGRGCDAYPNDVERVDPRHVLLGFATLANP